MKKMNDRPQRSMTTSLQRDVIRRPGVKNIDADLGNLNNTRHMPSSGSMTHAPGQSQPKPPQSNTSNGVKPSSTTLTSKQMKLASSVSSTKGYQRSSKPAGPIKAAQYVALENSDESPVDFPIDMVYTWVDGGDEEWLAIRKKFQPTQKNIPDDSLLACRWRDFDELRLSIESVYKFAPWIRTIYIISDFQRPHWFDETNPGKIKFVDHPQLFQEFEEHLPTFNSHAIEAHLHRIEGLAEHFIYANDDTFFGHDVFPLDFFTVDGKFKVFLTITDMETEKSLREYARQTPPKPVFAVSNSKLNPKVKQVDNTPPVPEHLEILPYFTAQAVTNNILDQVFGPSPATRKRLKHQMKAFRKSTFEWCWENELMQLYLFNTSSTRFRSLGDVDATSLISHVGLRLSEAVPASISSKYYGVEDTTNIQQMFYHLFKHRPVPKLYCINDNLLAPSADILEAIRVGFEKYLPHKYL
jgi:hypothetical protein